MDARQTIIDALTHVIRSEPEGLGDTENFVDSGLLDSLDALTFLFELDKRFGRKVVEDHEVDNDIFTIARLLELASK